MDNECPAYFLDGVFLKFIELHKGRRYTESGPCPITFDDIMNWRRLYEWETSLWELSVIRELDQIYIRVVVEALKKR